MKKYLALFGIIVFSTACSFYVTEDDEEFVIPVIEEIELEERNDESIPSIIGPQELPNVDLIQPIPNE